MKKIILLLFTCFTLAAVNAQTQRKKAPVAATDSSTVTTPAKTRGEKRAMMKDLNLTREQKGRLKEMHRANKDKIANVENDDTLSETAKKEKLKVLKKEQLAATLSLLNDEQEAKLKAQQKTKRKGNEEVLMMDEEQ